MMELEMIKNENMNQASHVKELDRNLIACRLSSQNMALWFSFLIPTMHFKLTFKSWYEVTFEVIV